MDLTSLHMCWLELPLSSWCEHRVQDRITQGQEMLWLITKTPSLPQLATPLSLIVLMVDSEWTAGMKVDCALNDRA
jgi:hypothetical protein